MSITSIVPELRALIHRVGARKDVTVVRKVIAGGLAAKGVADVARRLATPCPLRSTVRATVRGVRARPRRDARVDAMRANLPGDHPRVLARLLGCALPRRATDDAVLALVGAALDALVADSDEALRARFAGGAWATVNVFDRGVGDDPPPARLRRALDVMTLGRAQPEALVELALTIEPLVPLPKFVDVSRHGMVVQVLAGREGSDLPTRLGDVALWDTSVVGDTALEHRAIVAAVLSPGAYNADALFREQRGEVSVLVDASVAVGMKVGDSWRAPVVLQ